MKILVTGGAGYIGSFAVRALVARGHEVTVIDDLQTGHRRAVDRAARLIVRALADEKAMRRAMRGQDAVMHFAGSIDVAESMRDPQKYYRNNFANGMNLLSAMMGEGVRHIVFSSTAAVYGSPKRLPIRERSPTEPINHYGASKLLFEKALGTLTNAGLRFAALRYFNVAGAAPDASLGEAHDPETHIIPRTLQAARRGEVMRIFGTDYPTPDGTCIRDYVHVQDLIDAHLRALRHIRRGGESGAFNVGSQSGYSVREVIAACERASGRAIAVQEAGRRAGDPPVLVADSSKLRRTLKWRPRHSLAQIAQSAWQWHNREGRGSRQ